MVLGLGATPDQIIFAHPYKQESHLRFAREKGVQLMTFDTEEELFKIQRIYPEAKYACLGRRQQLSIYLFVRSPIHTSAS